MINIRIPHDPTVSTKFFARFTATDIVRISLPVLIGYIVTPSSTVLTAAGVLSGLCVGAGLYLWRPEDQPVDQHIRNASSWWLEQRNPDDREEVETVNTQHVKTSDGHRLALIAVQPTNLGMKSADEQAAAHDIYKDLLETISYPITVHSVQHTVDLADYIERLESQDVEMDRLKEKYTEYCRGLSDDDLLDTTHLISVRVPTSTTASTSLERFMSDLPFTSIGQQTGVGGNVLTELDRRCREIESALESAELSTERITKPQFDNVVDTLGYESPDTSASYVTTADESEGDWRKAVVVTDYPASLPLAWVTDVLDVEGRVEIAQSVRPEKPAETTNGLHRGVEKLSAEIGSWVNAGYLGTNDLEAKLDDANWMLELLTDRTDTPVTYSVTITAVGDSKRACDQTFRQVCDRLETMQISYRKPLWQTHDVYRQQSPFYRRYGEGQLMPTRSAAAGFPFATAVTRNDSGIVFGESRDDGDPVLMDRFEWSSHSIARMGMVGSGKSYAAKVEVLRSWLAYDDLQIYIVDPKKEYSDLVANLGGRTYNLHEDSHQLGFKTADVISYEVDERGQEENVDDLVDILRQIYDFASRSTDKTLVLIDEARILLNDPEGRRVLNQFVLEARDTNTAITMVTQNASHFTYCREGREILDNVPGKVFMRHDRVPDSVVQYFQLSSREVQQLYKLKTGTDASYSEAVLKVSDRTDTTLRIESTAVEHAIIDSGRAGA